MAIILVATTDFVAAFRLNNETHAKVFKHGHVVEGLPDKAVSWYIGKGYIIEETIPGRSSGQKKAPAETKGLGDK